MSTMKGSHTDTCAEMAGSDEAGTNVARPEVTGLVTGTFALRRVDPEADLDILHGWMNDLEVAEFWHLAGSRSEIADYLQGQVDSTHSTPYVGVLDGDPVSYWELYRADLDRLSAHYDARPHDLGLHLLLGPVSARGRGLGAQLIRAVTRALLDADPEATRVVAEPDVRNTRSVRAFERAGYRRVADLALPEKVAALVVREREPRTSPHGQR
jgi:acetyl CoA:N6-hydroxylysine acetyl transferase